MITLSIIHNANKYCSLLQYEASRLAALLTGLVGQYQLPTKVHGKVSVPSETTTPSQVDNGFVWFIWCNGIGRRFCVVAGLSFE